MDATTKRHTRHTLAELMVQDNYQPDEVAELLGIDADVVHHAAFRGDLKAEVIGHTIVSIRREDVLDWFDRQR
jgi:hypothetical protein